MEHGLSEGGGVRIFCKAFNLLSNKIVAINAITHINPDKINCRSMM